MPAKVLFVIVGTVLVFGLWGLIRSLRAAESNRLRSLRLSPAERSILETNLALYRRLPPELQERLEGLVQEFRASKNFEGRGGLELRDEIVLTIAAGACMLLLGRPVRTVYPELSSVIVYPSAFRGKGHRDQEHDGTVRLGESWGTGAVVLSWDDSLAGTVAPEDGHNVVFHEFAHQLDQEDGAADGTPNLGHRPSRYATWAEILGGEFLELRRELARGQVTWMNAYGATNEAEFFAVATEFFFERSAEMKRREPELYAELERYYLLDPASWNSL